MLDQTIISRPLYENNSALNYENGQNGVYFDDWLMYEEEDFSVSPFRTYSRGKYTGGISDHLPIYIKLKIE